MLSLFIFYSYAECANNLYVFTTPPVMIDSIDSGKDAIIRMDEKKNLSVGYMTYNNEGPIFYTPSKSELKEYVDSGIEIINSDEISSNTEMVGNLTQEVPVSMNLSSNTNPINTAVLSNSLSNDVSTNKQQSTDLPLNNSTLKDKNSDKSNDNKKSNNKNKNKKDSIDSNSSVYFIISHVLFLPVLFI